MQQNNTPIMIANVLIFLSSRVMRQEEITELIEHELGDYTVSLATELTAIFSLCSRTILHIL